MRTLRLATRTSPLALRQAELVAGALSAAAARADEAGSARPAGSGGAVRVELVEIETSGDRRLDVPIGALGGQGVFVKEVELALLDGRADLAVHSAKDLPSSAGADELEIAAVPPRADPRDALVGCRLDALAPGARIATGAPRRRAQLAWLRPDLRFEELRGNIDTRLRRVPDGGAVVVAVAALERLGRLDELTEVLATSVVLPQVGQGALAVQCRVGDEATAAVLRLIDDLATHRCVTAERAFLRELGGGCDLPVGAHAVVETGGGLALDAMVASEDGLVVLRRSASGEDPERLGAGLARELLDRCGGAELLASGAGGP